MGALGSFRQNGGWVRSAKMAVGFVPPKWRPPRTGLSRRVEIPDRELAPRQRAPLVTVDRRQPGGELGIVRRLGDEVAARAPHATRSIWAAAIRQAAAWRCAPASAPAISRASASISPESVGSRNAVSSKPWRRALRAALALPSRVFGPVLLRALARLAASLSTLIMPQPPARAVPAR